MMKNLYLTLLFWACCCIVTASSLDDIYKKWQDGKVIVPDLISFFEARQIPLNTIQANLINEDESKRLFYFYCIQQEIYFSTDDLTKKNNVYFLINYGLNDPSTAIVYQVINGLELTSLDYFSQKSINRLSSLVMDSSTSHKKKLIKLSGQVNCFGLIPYYKTQIKTSSNNKDFWSITLALARMGEEDQVQYSLDRLKQSGINDNTIYHLVTDLIYIQNKEVYAYLLEQILNTDKNCTSTNPDNEIRIVCAYRLMEMVAPHIKEFPVNLYPSGDIISDNYQQTLSTVRDWILSNIQTFELK